MKKLLYPLAFALTAFLFVYSCSTEEEDTTPPPQVQQPTPEPEPEVSQYTLTVTAGEGGTVSTEGGTYDEGTEVTITATPEEGYEFVGWFNEDGELISDEISYTIEIGTNFQLVSSYNKINLPFQSKSPRYSLINETTSNFYNQFYFDNYMTRELHESLFSIEDNLMYMIQERDAVYYDFDHNGSLDFFGFEYWSERFVDDWGTRPGRYVLIKDFSWGNREKIYFESEISFNSTLDLADLDGDSQLEIIQYSYNVHQNAISPYNSSLEEKPIVIIQLNENFEFNSFLLSDSITSHDGASGDVDNDGDVDILLWGLIELSDYYNNMELAYPHFLINDGNYNFRLSKAFKNNSIIDEQYGVNGDLPYLVLRTTFYDLIDINNDGFLDIIESYRLTAKEINPNDIGKGLKIYLGDGSGKFDYNNKIKVFPNNPKGYQITSLGATYLDYDNDGDLDIFLSGTRAEDGAFVGGQDSSGSTFYNNYFIYVFKNNGNEFEDVTSNVIDKSFDLSRQNFSHFYDINLKDIDGDGDFDLIPAKNTGWFTYPQLNNLYWENNGGFFNIREEGGFNTSIFSN